jgi:hypothetical protein
MAGIALGRNADPNQRQTAFLRRGWLCSGWLWLAALSALALDPAQPPGRNFDLGHWKLTLPVDSAGGTNGNAAEVSAAQLVADYTNALYFYTGPDGAMVFWCPVIGAHTTTSSYPRSELRELLSPPSSSSNWLAWGTHVLDAQCKVSQMPSSKKVIIGQIHSYTGNAYPLIKLQFNNGTIEALVKHSPSSDADTKYTFMNVGLSNLISYQIKMLDGLLSLAVNGSTQSVNLFQTDPAWAQQTMYYKAGNYCQDNAGTTNEGALVSFYLVRASHAPSITHQPASLTATGGQAAAFSVSANGNGPLSYRWRLNSTNLPGATGAGLSFTNVQSANAGSYSAVVSDSLGSVTSAVAALTVNTPPSITGQPQSRTVPPGGSVTLRVAASGNPPPAYQWRFNSSEAPGATAASLVLTNFRSSQEGNYLAVVSNALGIGTSAPAQLYLDTPLRFTNSALDADGRFTALLLGIADSNHVVQASSDLTNWTSLLTNSAPSGMLQVTDDAAAGYSSRFYRAW